MDIIKLIYNAYLDEPVVYGKNMDRVIELEEYFNKILTAEQFKLFKEFDDLLLELRCESELKLIKYVIYLCKTLLF